MPKISHTAEIMPESAIRMLTPYADQCKADGIKVYHLNIGTICHTPTRREPTPSDGR